ncbi:MAG: very short patch repair endonuclease [Planctomycetota bacterium]
MALARTEGTRPERRVCSILRRLGYQFETNVKELPGTPDIVMWDYGIVIFVHGCFWHQHHCGRGRLPKNNRRRWMKKLIRTKMRDSQNIKKLEKLGWQVIVIWECQTYNRARLQLMLLDLLI